MAGEHQDSDLNPAQEAAIVNEAAASAAGAAALNGPNEPEWNALLAERDELKNQLLRQMAEMDNVRKRTNRERDEERRYAALPLIRDLLPALDNLQRAVQTGEQTADAAALVQGVRMVLKQFDDVLTRCGAESIAALGHPFDPHFHEALQQQPSAEHPPMTVLQELERGYKLHDRVIRPSKVIVSSQPAAQ
ncbi:nucleotide exchange factor GrpE [Planctomicrobium sp. SH664]|uniref:nucleotide exchange factor GrpE n=1 Tax=Planctomicrobium sp. SH664 TaxID=3448125 RepID=UPI003F5C21A8